MASKVIAGDYQGSGILVEPGSVYLAISYGWGKTLQLSKDNIKEYEIMDQKTRKSASSAVGRAFLGSVVLGPVGLFAGLSAKSKTTGVQIAIEFKDGGRSLIELSGKHYERFLKTVF